MGFTEQELAGILQTLAISYIFNYCFEQNNPGYEFDIEAWLKMVQDATGSELTIMTPERQQKLFMDMGQLDNFKKTKVTIAE